MQKNNMTVKELIKILKKSPQNINVDIYSIKNDCLSDIKEVWFPKTKLDERLAAIQQAKQDFLDAENETDLIYADKVKKKKLKRDNNIIGRFFKQKKQQKEDDRIAKEKADAATVAQNATYYTPTGTSGGGAGQGIDISGAGTVRSSDNNFQGDSGPTNQQESEYGYSTDFGFARGGRVNFKHGGLASIL